MEDLSWLSCLCSTTVYWLARVSNIFRIQRPLDHEDTSIPNAELYVPQRKPRTELDIVSNETFDYLLCEKSMFNVQGEKR